MGIDDLRFAWGCIFVFVLDILKIKGTFTVASEDEKLPGRIQQDR